MKTNKLPKKKFHLDSLLAIAGWSLAIFVSLLYLREVTSKAEPPAPAAAAPKALVPAEENSQRVNTLLLESRSYLANRAPERAINRITTLWSVCHSSHQSIPPESHEIFAQAVSQLSDAAAQKRPRPVQIIRPERQVVARSLHNEEPVTESKPRGVTKRVVSKAQFELPRKNYPTAKKPIRNTTFRVNREPREPQKAERTTTRPRPEPRRQARRNPGFPEPPRARHNPQRGQRQGAGARRNPGFPPPPHRAPPRGGSFPTYDNPPEPGTPPGY